MNSRAAAMTHSRGFALFTALLLLMIITILAMSMFRAFGTQEHIAGNVREKERAFHAAESVQQFGEWWLLQGPNVAIGAQACAAGILNGNTPGVGQICTTTLVQNGQTVTAPATWASATTYLPTGMSVTPGVNGTNGDPPYAAVPGFYIADVGAAADAQGEAYQIDSYGYGGSTATVAVVESVYEVQQGVVCRSCNP
jgi:type IV pilus assembly protein PilX